MSQPPLAAERPAPASPATRAGTSAASRDARQRAAVILEVLAGARTPTQAAQALSLSLPRYYQLENVAVQGLVAACEPIPKGRVRSADTQLAALHKQQQRLQRELARQQALVRLTQRTLGLAAPAPAPAGKTSARAGAKGRKPRRPVARALRGAARLRQEADGLPVSPAAPASVAEGPP